MGADIEWLVGILRAGRDYERYGDNWDIAATIKRLENGEAEIMGLNSDRSNALLQNVKAIRKASHDAGISRLVFHRRLPDGTFKKVSLE
ncbi:MAG: hypothetical protein GY820_17080 [Gammaproteobacteria bacterium]|nr:hypothetical protein [Gammaproteobacteria bacterium]